MCICMCVYISRYLYIYRYIYILVLVHCSHSTCLSCLTLYPWDSHFIVFTGIANTLSLEMKIWKISTISKKTELCILILIKRWNADAEQSASLAFSCSAPDSTVRNRCHLSGRHIGQHRSRVVSDVCYSPWVVWLNSRVFCSGVTRFSSCSKSPLCLFLFQLGWQVRYICWRHSDTENYQLLEMWITVLQYLPWNACKTCIHFCVFISFSGLADCISSFKSLHQT